MEREEKQAAGPQHRREASDRPRIGNDERRERPRGKRSEPDEDRTPEEAGYGYGV